ncbi:MAG: toll/interleukin-1 receptor domain-containing protein [Clostridia bacterium]|nr:toll/interleukin-1 receptor domain-containing protein [Clostridia bacterium]
MAELFQCSVCGGELKKEEGGNFRCVCCGAAFSEKRENVEETVKRVLGEEKYAMTSAARRNLWRAMHSPEIDSGECAGYARALKSFIPEDYYANFAEIANSKGDREVSEFLSSSTEADMETYADAVLDFMLRSMTPGTLPAVSGYIERAFEKDAKKFSEYFDLYEKEAEKVSEGIYELTTPRDVFLAYSSKDYMFVTDLCAHLEEQGMTCFMSSRNLRHGRGAVENYDVALKTAMDSCNVFVFVSSKNSRSLSCDALKTEISYMRGKDIRFAPAEMKNIPYDKLPASYKTCRVEYLLDDYGENFSSADRMVKEFFSGFEWRRTKEEVSDSVLHYLTAQPSYEGVGKAQIKKGKKRSWPRAETHGDGRVFRGRKKPQRLRNGGGGKARSGLRGRLPQTYFVRRGRKRR